MEPLIELTRDRWPELLGLFKEWWPHGVAGHSVLETQYKKPALSRETGFRIFCPWGDINNGAIAFNRKGASYEIAIEPLHENLDKLTKALCSAKVINWDHPSLLLSYIDNDVKTNLPKLCDSLNLKILKECKAYKHVYNSDVGFNNMTIPLKTYMGKLEPKDLQMIDQSWAYHDSSSHLIFQDIINNGLTYALYSSDHDIRAWMTINEAGVLCHLYCVPEFRRCGYAEYIVKYATNDLLKRNKKVLLLTDDHNLKSRNLFAKLNFICVGFGTWVYLKKILRDNDNITYL